MAEETLAAILAEIRGVADNMEVAATRFDEEHKQDVRCMKHPHCFRHDDLMRELTSLRKLADRIEAAAERERRQLRSLVGRFANCHEDNEDFGALQSLARFVLANTPSAVVDGEPVAVPHGRVAEKAGAESRPFVGVDLAKDKPTFVCATIAPGNAAMRDALKRILAIEGYGAPWLEAKCIAQKALEGEQCTPPITQERPQIEQPGNAAAMREALLEALEYCESDQKSGIAYSDNDVLVPMLRAALAAPARNCDRFATGKEAWLAFDDEVPIWCQDHSRKGSGCNDREVADCGICVAEWLFAPTGGSASSKPLGRPATEKEVESGFSGVVWCKDCSTHCPLSHGDALSVCEHYSAPAKGCAE